MSDVNEKEHPHSRGWNGDTVLQKSLSQSQMALDEFKRVLNKAVSMINQSEKKEHIYREAGDLIYRANSLLEKAKEGLDEATYYAARKQYKRLKKKVSPKMRKQLDNIVKRAHQRKSRRVAKRYLQRKKSEEKDSASGLPDSGGQPSDDWIGKGNPGGQMGGWSLRYDEEFPNQTTDENNEQDFDNGSIYDVEHADDMLKHQPNDPMKDQNEWGRLRPFNEIGDSADDAADTLFEIDDDIRYH